MENWGITESEVDLSNLSSISSIKDIPEFKHNPFTMNFTFKKKAYYDKADGVKVSIEDVEVTNSKLKPVNLVLAEKLYKDTAPFSKIFINAKVDYMAMKPTTLKLLLYIINERLNTNIDFIILNCNMVSEKLNMSLSTIYSGVIELVKGGIMVRKNDPNMFWINPHIIFRGDRKKIRFSNG